MDLKRRQSADPTKLATSLLESCSRIAVVADAYRQVINLLAVSYTHLTLPTNREV